MTDPLVTVVIPCFNHGEFLSDAVHSAREQTYESKEIIVVNDGSDDESTNQVLAQLEKQGIRVLWRGHYGPSEARNAGIQEGTGVYVLPLDADDKIHPKYLETAVPLLEENPEVGIVYSDAEYFGEESGRWPVPDYSFPEILIENTIFSAMIYRRTDWEAVGGYDSEMREGLEDYDFVLSLVERGVHVLKIPEVLFYYRIRTESRNRNMDLEMVKFLRVQMFRKHHRLYEQNAESLIEAIVQMQDLQSRNEIVIDRLTRTRKAKEVFPHKTVEAYERWIGTLETQSANLRHTLDLINNQPLLRLRRGVTSMTKHLRKSGGPKVIAADPKTSAPTDASPCGAYREWFSRNRYGGVGQEQIKAHIERLESAPLITVVCAVDEGGKVEVRKRLLPSIEKQLYPNWELRIVCYGGLADGTTTDLKRHSNVYWIDIEGTVTEALVQGIQAAKGDYISLAEYDAKLEPDALYWIVEAVARIGADFIYTDEDVLDEDDKLQHPRFKSDFSPDLLWSCNYIGHLVAIKKEILCTVGGPDPEFDPFFDYDLFLRASESARLIYHIHRVLYHGNAQRSQRPTGQVASIEIRALRAALGRARISGQVIQANSEACYRVKRDLLGQPLISLVVSCTEPHEQKLTSTIARTSYKTLEIVLLGEASHISQVSENLMHCFGERLRVRLIEPESSNNYASMINRAVEAAKGDHIILLDPRVEMTNEDWIEVLLEHSQQENVGAVGGLLLNEDRTIYHTGMVVGADPLVHCPETGFEESALGLCGRANVIRNVTVIGGSCMMFKKRVYEVVNGFDEYNLRERYHDADFCLRILEAGYLNVYTPYAQGRIDADKKAEAADTELGFQSWDEDYFRNRHRDVLGYGDYYYSKPLLEIPSFIQPS